MLVRGSTIGRYVVLDKVGAGGMGVVYSAYDPELDRKLAIKLLSGSDDASSLRARRLLREAQAMAKLNHPNVITVHDVGTVHGQVFVAMEFVDGGTLREWLKTERTWQEVVAMFVAAGRGLWAAHEAGLVHRDFKPDNVMLSRDGRVVVMDFGLARAFAPGEGAAEDSALLAAQRRGGVTGLEATVTAEGAVLGTPAYMSAEQHEGRPTDARSDQFAFGVAMYEALFDQRPFQGKDFTALAVNVCCGNLQEPPAASSVPHWLRMAVLTMLAVDPDTRHPDMQTLLSLLSADRSGLRTRILPLAAAVAVAGAGVGAALLIVGNEEGPCAYTEGRLDATWNEDRAATLRAAFKATGLAFGPEAWPAVETAVQQYTDAWSEGYTAACHATLVRHDQPVAMLDRRVACLTRAEGELTALLDLFEAGDPVAVEHALSAVQGLAAPERCANVEQLTEALSPEDLAVARRVEALAPELAQVAAMHSAGMMIQGQARAEALARDARALGHPPLLARAVLHLAAFQNSGGQADQAERSYREALSVALRGKADEVAANAAVALVGLVGEDPQRHDEAEGWAEVATALLGRSGSDPDAEARLLAFRASILRKGGRTRAAADALERALAQTVRAHGPDDARVANASAEFADVLVAMGERHRARELYERALEIDEAILGSDHPKSATILHALGDLSLASGAYGPALDYHLRGLKIREALPADHAIELVQSLRALGSAYGAMGRVDVAATHLSRALAVTDEGLGPEHPLATAVLADQAAAKLRGGSPDKAVQLLQEALTRRRRMDPSATRVGLYGAPSQADLTAALAAARASLPSSP